MNSSRKLTAEHYISGIPAYYSTNQSGSANLYTMVDSVDSSQMMY